jgi:hypothetical protein
LNEKLSFARRIMKLTIIATAVLALAVPAAAQAAPARHKHRTHAVHRSVAPRAQQQIACTAIGCVPVPRGCGQTPGHTWSGMPSGNDIIVCPPGVAPFR